MISFRGRRPGKLTVNASKMFSGQLARLLAQGAYFVLAARVLGVERFGAFSGLLALVSVLAPFAPLGALNIMVRNLSRGETDAGEQFRRALVLTTIGAAIIGAVLLALYPVTAPIGSSVLAMMLLAFSELLASKVIDLSGAVFTAREAMGRAALYPAVLATVRLVVGFALVASGAEVSLLSWVAAYAAASTLVAVVTGLLTLRRVGPGRPHLRKFAGEWRHGLLFSVSLASQTVYNDLDKAMLSRLSTLEATGVYSVAYRVIDFSFAPMRALLAATYPRFFKRGASGLASSSAFARRLLPPTLLMNAIVTTSLVLGAPALPLVLGSEYGDSVKVVQALAIIPLFRGVSYLASDALTGADRQGLRSAIQLGIAGTNFAANLVLIPAYGYWGATISSVACDLLLAVLMVVAVLRLTSRAPRGATISADG